MIAKRVYNKAAEVLVIVSFRLLSAVAYFFDYILNIIIIPIPQFPNTYRGPRVAAAMIEKSLPVLNEKCKPDTLIRFYCPGVMPIYRARTAVSKEPETIKWIDSFEDKSIFWDIGANVGVYSMYAAKTGHSVIAFEPSSPNYFVLNKNIEINDLDSKVRALNLAFTRKKEIAYLKMGDTTLGAALNSFDSAVREDGATFRVQFNQATLGFTVDDFIESFDLSVPNYIKIDVDGNEGDILTGMSRTISQPDLRSVLIELSSARPDYEDILRYFSEAGFSAPKIFTAAFDFSSDIKNHIFERI